jgi:hypothetical protein
MPPGLREPAAFHTFPEFTIVNPVFFHGYLNFFNFYLLPHILLQGHPKDMEILSM